MDIKLKGAEILKDNEKNILDKLSNEYYVKIQRKIKNLTSFALDIKEYSKGGKRKKYSIHLKVIAPTKTFEADDADWDFARTLHNVFNKALNEIEKRFKD